MSPYLYMLCGFLVGSAVGLSGVGGGSLMTPILILLFGQSPSVAVGTDLAFAALTKVVATGRFHSSRRVDWRIVARLLLGSIPATILASVFLWHRKLEAVSVNLLIEQLLAVLLALTAFALLVPIPKRIKTSAAAFRWYSFAERHEFLLSMILGWILGLAVSLTSVGAGAFGIFALSMIYPRRLPADRLVATDIAHALPITLVGGLNHVLLGDTDQTILLWLLLGSFPGALIASSVAMKLPARVLRPIIGLVLAVVSIRLFSAT